jgi:hypothetical protein
MATKTYQGFNKRTTDAILKGISLPIRKNEKYFRIMSIMVDDATQMTFRLEGARGRKGWARFSKLTMQTPRGTWNIRYGTDKKPKRTAAELRKYKSDNNLWYKPGPMQGYKGDRRYGPNSKLLQASGEFRKSFKTISIRNGQMFYGIRGLKMRMLGKKIMSDPTRQVLFVTSADRKKWGKAFALFVDRGIKF